MRICVMRLTACCEMNCETYCLSLIVCAGMCTILARRFVCIALASCTFFATFTTHEPQSVEGRTPGACSQLPGTRRVRTGKRVRRRYKEWMNEASCRRSRRSLKEFAQVQKKLRYAAFQFVAKKKLLRGAFPGRSSLVLWLLLAPANAPALSSTLSPALSPVRIREAAARCANRPFVFCQRSAAFALGWARSNSARVHCESREGRRTGRGNGT